MIADFESMKKNSGMIRSKAAAMFHFSIFASYQKKRKFRKASRFLACHLRMSALVQDDDSGPLFRDWKVVKDP